MVLFLVILHEVRVYCKQQCFSREKDAHPKGSPAVTLASGKTGGVSIQECWVCLSFICKWVCQQRQWYRPLDRQAGRQAGARMHPSLPPTHTPHHTKYIHGVNEAEGRSSGLSLEPVPLSLAPFLKPNRIYLPAGWVKKPSRMSIKLVLVFWKTSQNKDVKNMFT